MSLLEPSTVVKDDTIILLDIEYTLRHLGLSKILTATTLAKAATLCELTDIRLTILDYELRPSANTLPLAHALSSCGITLIFLATYGSDVDFPPSLS